MLPTISPIVETEDCFYVDYSILSTFRMCKEKARLSYREHHDSRKTKSSLDFGAAWHEAMAELYRAKVNTTDLDELKKAAMGGFIKEVKDRGGSLPISSSSEEHRSIDRGLALVECYIEKYKNEPFTNIIRPDDGKPYVEIGFAIFLMEWGGKPVMFVGRIDRIMKSRLTGLPMIIETKTTTQGLTNFVKQVRPNHQITGYHMVTAELLQMDIRETLWDCVFVSKRQPNPKNGRWGLLGVDPKEDFARQPTRRSATDIKEFIKDLNFDVVDYLKMCDSKMERWPRNAPTACHMFGGCLFRDVCNTNLNPNILKTNFIIRKWEPWKGITVPKDEGK